MLTAREHKILTTSLEEVSNKGFLNLRSALNIIDTFLEDESESTLVLNEGDEDIYDKTSDKLKNAIERND